MGWRPVDWDGRVLPEPKFENKCTSFFEFFGFERPLLRYGGSVFSITDEERTRTEWRILGSDQNIQITLPTSLFALSFSPNPQRRNNNITSITLLASSISASAQQQYWRILSNSASAAALHQQHRRIGILAASVSCTGRNICPYTSINSGHISLYTLTPPDMHQTPPDMLQTPPDMHQTMSDRLAVVLCIINGDVH